MTAPTKPTPAPQTKAPTPPPTQRAKVTFSKPAAATGHRVVFYGPGGIGKTTAAVNATGRTVFFDLDESLSRLSIEEKPDTVPVETWNDLRTALQSDGWEGVSNIVIDSFTKAEELCVAHMLATVKTDKGMFATKIEDYGFGKGYQHLFETFLPILGDLDRHCRAGRNVILICHECTNTVPNPSGEDWLRYEPRLSSPSSGKGSIRLRLKEWADHVLFLTYDVAVDKETGKGRGSGTRTIYTSELPFCMAKSRTASAMPIPANDPTQIWPNIFK